METPTSPCRSKYEANLCTYIAIANKNEKNLFTSIAGFRNGNSRRQRCSGNGGSSIQSVCQDDFDFSRGHTLYSGEPS